MYLITFCFIKPQKRFTFALQNKIKVFIMTHKCTNIVTILMNNNNQNKQQNQEQQNQGSKMLAV